jgi:ribosomal protein S18 acetylase RimI-like enzyme
VAVMETIPAQACVLSAATQPFNTRPLAELAGGRHSITAVLRLLREAGNPYCDWFFGGPQQAEAALVRAIGRPTSEFAAQRVMTLVGPSGVAAVFVALSGEGLARCRKRDARAAIAHAGADRRAMRARIGESRDLFLPLVGDDFYISRLAVSPPLRCRGLGRATLRKCLAAGQALGFARFVLDVAVDNGPAIRLYRSFGFRVEATCEAAGMRYLRMAFDTRVKPQAALADLVAWRPRPNIPRMAPSGAC